MLLSSFDENSTIYFDLALKLADKFYEVILMDFMGHGYSFGPKQNIKLSSLFQDFSIMI